MDIISREQSRVLGRRWYVCFYWEFDCLMWLLDESRETGRNETPKMICICVITKNLETKNLKRILQNG